MRNSLTGIKNLDEQQISIMRDSLNKELLEEQLIEKDIQLGDREIISALKEIEQGKIDSKYLLKPTAADKQYKGHK
jgi:hypothetical protein